MKVEYKELPLSLLDPCPFKFRPPGQLLDYDVIGRIRKGSRKHGLLSVILVVPKEGGRYWIAYGQHRIKAQVMEGRTTIGALIANLTLDEIGLISISENANRNNEMDPIAEGRFFVDQLEKKRRTVADLAEETGLGEGYIQTRIDLARDLEPSIQAKVSQRQLPIGLAHVISKHPRIEQVQRLNEMQHRRRQLTSTDAPNENECQKKCPVHCPKPYGKLVTVKDRKQEYLKFQKHASEIYKKTKPVGPSCAHGKGPNERCPDCEGEKT